MTKSARQLFAEAMKLPQEERETLIRLLIESVGAESDKGVDDAWRVEIEPRLTDLDSGTVQAIPWEELRARLYRL